MSHQIYFNYQDVKNRLNNGTNFIGLIPNKRKSFDDRDCGRVLNEVDKVMAELGSDEPVSVFEMFFKFGYNLINVKNNYSNTVISGYEDNNLYLDYGQSLFHLNDQMFDLVIAESFKPYAFYPKSVIIFDRTNTSPESALEIAKNGNYTYLVYNDGEKTFSRRVKEDKVEEVKEIQDPPKPKKFWGKNDK